MNANLMLDMISEASSAISGDGVLDDEEVKLTIILASYVGLRFASHHVGC